MNRSIFLAVIALVLFVACGSDSEEPEGHMHGEETMGSMQESESLPSLDEWIRPEPVDVSVVDVNEDGFVYQDPMDFWIDESSPRANMK